MKELEKPELIPVIELSPFDFKKKRWKIPSDYTNKKEWDDFTLKCLKDSGISDLFPIEGSSELYNIENISNYNLKIILKNHFKIHYMKTGIRYWNDRLGVFDGGLVIKIKDNILASPSCCCSLSDIKTWKSIPDEGTEDWQYIDIGHPECYGKYKIENNKIVFSYQESFSIKKTKYNRQMKKVMNDLNVFYKRIIDVIQSIYPDRNDYEYVAYRLIFGFSKW